MNTLHPLFRSVLAPLMPTELDHTIALNRGLALRARTMKGLSDAISPPQVSHHAPAAASPNARHAAGAPSLRELQVLYEGLFAAPIDPELHYNGPIPDEARRAWAAHCETLRTLTVEKVVAHARSSRDWHQDRVHTPEGDYHRARVKAIDDVVARLEATLPQ